MTRKARKIKKGKWDGISAIDRTTVMRGKLRVLLWGRDHEVHDAMWDALVVTTLEIADRHNDEDETSKTWSRDYTDINRRKAVASTLGAIILKEDRQSRGWVLDALELAIGEVAEQFTGDRIPKSPWMTDRGRLPEMLVKQLETAIDGIFNAAADGDEDMVVEHATMLELVSRRLRERV